MTDGATLATADADVDKVICWSGFGVSTPPVACVTGSFHAWPAGLCRWVRRRLWGFSNQLTAASSRRKQKKWHFWMRAEEGGCGVVAREATDRIICKGKSSIRGSTRGCMTAWEVVKNLLVKLTLSDIFSLCFSAQTGNLARSSATGGTWKYAIFFFPLFVFVVWARTRTVPGRWVEPETTP